MAKTTDHASAVFWQLVEDDDVQKHLRNGAGQARDAWQRVARLPGSKAVEDKKLYDKVRNAAIELARAVKLLEPEPEPRKKRRGLQLAVVAVTAGVVALIVKQSRSSEGAVDGDPQGQSDRVPQGAGPEREGAPARAGAA